MKKNRLVQTLCIIILLTCSIFMLSCGGGSDPVIPDDNNDPPPRPAYTMITDAYPLTVTPTGSVTINMYTEYKYYYFQTLTLTPGTFINFWTTGDLDLRCNVFAPDMQTVLFSDDNSYDGRNPGITFWSETQAMYVFFQVFPNNINATGTYQVNWQYGTY